MKQQEIEGSHRRVPSTARASRIHRDPLRTPIRTSFEQSQAPIETPSKLYFGQAQPSEVLRIETPRIRRPVKSPRKINLSGALPGFQNAFLASQPLADAIGRRSPPGSPMPRSPPSSPTTRLAGNTHSFDLDDRSEASQNQHKSHAVIDNDFDFVMVEEEKTQEMDATIQPFNWTSEVCQEESDPFLSANFIFTVIEDYYIPHFIQFRSIDSAAFTRDTYFASRDRSRSFRCGLL